jgi:probable HAF family extracellular repeat protein
MTAVAVIAALAIPTGAAAQPQTRAQPRYILIDLGTFGGPQSSVPCCAQVINNQGMAVGAADTSIPDPHTPSCFNSDCFVSHGFLWRRGVLTDLGALPGVNSSAVNWVNAWGMAAGVSSNGAIDPLTGGPEAHAVLWRNGQIRDLGTLGGNESVAAAVNNWGQVTGWAANATPDPFSMAGWGTQTRAFLWQGSAMRDLGTLGGPDSFAVYVNDGGQVAGWSYTNAIANAATGVPTQDPFLWQDGRVRDLGSFGGTLAFVGGLNNSGEVVGQSNLAGDIQYHPFLWDGGTLKDLGTLGGDNGSAIALNDAGVVAGEANLATPCPGCGEPQVYHPFLWKDGVMTDLGVVPGDRCGFAWGINARNQVVGASGVCHGGVDAFLWENGTIVNLNTQVASSALHLTYAWWINDRGEIAGTGVLPNGNQHAVLLIPTEEADRDGIASNAPAPSTVAPAAAPYEGSTSCADVLPWRARPAHGYLRAICSR